MAGSCYSPRAGDPLSEGGPADLLAEVTVAVFPMRAPALGNLTPGDLGGVLHATDLWPTIVGLVGRAAPKRCRMKLNTRRPASRHGEQTIEIPSSDVVKANKPLLQNLFCNPAARLRKHPDMGFALSRV